MLNKCSDASSCYLFMSFIHSFKSFPEKMIFEQKLERMSHGNKLEYSKSKGPEDRTSLSC